VQEDIWDLVRYPKLIEVLLEHSNPSLEELVETLAVYPKSIHSKATYLLEKNQDLLEEVNTLNQYSYQAFESIIADYNSDLSGNKHVCSIAIRTSSG